MELFSLTTKFPRYKTYPLSLEEAREYVGNHHRHHKPPQGHKFSIAAVDEDGIIRGVATCGRPVARLTDHRVVIEVVRLTTDGSPNACSFLYAACARIAKEMGYLKIQTFILENELGVSLKACGWLYEADSKGGQWVRTDGSQRRTDQPTCPKQRWAKEL